MSPSQEPTGPDISSAFLSESRKRLGNAVRRIRHCVAQLNDAQVWWRPSEGHNSIANILLHLCGNVRQWILCPLSGLPDTRDRPVEFSERGRMPGEELLGRLEEVAGQADLLLAEVTQARLFEGRRIQGFEETVFSAVFDSVTHLIGHTQEIVFITRLQLGDAYRFDWKPLTPEQGATPQSTTPADAGV